MFSCPWSSNCCLYNLHKVKNELYLQSDPFKVTPFQLWIFFAEYLITENIAFRLWSQPPSKGPWYLSKYFYQNKFSKQDPLLCRRFKNCLRSLVQPVVSHCALTLRHYTCLVLASCFFPLDIKKISPQRQLQRSPFFSSRFSSSKSVFSGWHWNKIIALNWLGWSHILLLSFCQIRTIYLNDHLLEIHNNVSGGLFVTNCDNTSNC